MNMLRYSYRGCPRSLGSVNHIMIFELERRGL